ncbi:MAG TPA: hypothetical protein VNS79_15770 [Sphingobium sp.]|nr:hypothetical protein [Sphingobium sp.]
MVRLFEKRCDMRRAERLGEHAGQRQAVRTGLRAGSVDRLDGAVAHEGDHRRGAGRGDMIDQPATIILLPRQVDQRQIEISITRQRTTIVAANHLMSDEAQIIAQFAGCRSVTIDQQDCECRPQSFTPIAISGIGGIPVHGT